MAKVSVNDEYVINGGFTIRRYINEEGDVKVTGTFSSHFYFEEITSLENYRYRIEGIEVIEEVFGSDDFNITYNFIANELMIPNDLSNLSTEQIQEIEKDFYDEEGYLLGSNISDSLKRIEKEVNE